MEVEFSRTTSGVMTMGLEASRSERADNPRMKAVSREGDKDEKLIFPNTVVKIELTEQTRAGTKFFLFL